MVPGDFVSLDQSLRQLFPRLFDMLPGTPEHLPGRETSAPWKTASLFRTMRAEQGRYAAARNGGMAVNECELRRHGQTMP